MDPRFFAVSAPLPDGSIVLHGQPGTPVPSDAIATFADGSAPWTWVSLAAGANGATITGYCTPHEWAGEATAAGVTSTLFPKLAPAP